MNNNANRTLIDDLNSQINHIKKLIEEVICLDHMYKSLAKAEKKLEAAKNSRDAFYRETRVPDIIFLNKTLRGKENLQIIATVNSNIKSIKANIKTLEAQRDARMKPFQELMTMVSCTNSPQHAHKAIQDIFQKAKNANPEGSLADKIWALFAIIKEIVTLNFSEVGGIWAAQKKRNEVRTSINGLFGHSQLQETERDEEIKILAVK